MITYNFVIKVHIIFEELGYQKNFFNRSDFLIMGINLLTEVKDFYDVEKIINDINFILENEKKINKMFINDKHLKDWKSLKWKKNKILLKNKESINNTFLITNSIFDDSKDIRIISSAFKDNLYNISYEHGKFYIGNNIYMRFSHLNDNRMFIYDSDDSLLCKIVLKDLEFKLIKNTTNFDLNSDCYHELKLLYDDKVVGKIEWSMLDKKKYGAARVTLNKELKGENLTFVLACAASTFLLEENTSKSSNAFTKFLFFAWIYNIRRSLQK